MKLAFTVPGRPKAKQRPRFGQGRTYTPKATQAYEEEIWIMARERGAKFGMFEDRPLILVVYAYYLRTPQSGIYPAEIDHAADVDNILKIVADGLKPAFRNDTQIIDMRGRKDFGVPERLEVELSDEA